MNQTPTLTWDAVGGADFYVVKVQDKTAGNAVVAHDNHVTGTSFTLEAALPLGHEYQWTVQAETNARVKSPVSTPADFTEISPFTGSYSGSFTGNTTNGTITFTIADSGAITVTGPGTGRGSVSPTGAVQMKAAAAGVSYMFTGTLTITGGNVSVSGTFAAKSKHGNDSGTWSITSATLTGQPLDTVTATAPGGNGITTVGSLAEAPEFSWQADSGASFYAVRVVEKTAHNAVVLNATGITGTSFVSTKFLTLGHNYQWSVMAFNDSGDTSPWTTNTFIVTSPLAGTYSGTYTGTAKVGNQAPSVSGSVLAGVGITGFTNVESPGNGNGTGTVDMFGQGVLKTQGPGKIGSVNVGNIAYTFTGTFGISSPSGSTEGTAGGTWTATFKGGTASGTWSASATSQELTGTPLDTPTLNQPIGPQTSLNPTFSWNTVSGADFYALRVDNLTTKRTVIVATDLTTNSFTPLIPLVLGDRYQWSVQAVTAGDNASPWSVPTPFTVTLATPSLHATDSLIDNTTPLLSWGSVTGADSYLVTLKDTANHAVVASVHVSGTTFAPSNPLTAGQSYQWQVQALSNNGDSSASSTASTFTVINPFAGTYSGSYQGTTGEGFPFSGSFSVTVGNDSVIALADGLTGKGLASFLGTIDLTGTAVVFGVTVTFTLTGTATVANGTASASGMFSGSANGDTATGTWSITETQLNGSPLDTPVLNGPTGSNISATPTFSWQTVSGASYYGLAVIDLTAKNATVIAENDITTTSYTPATPLKAGHRYEWILAAGNNQDDASARVSATFTVAS